VFLEGFADAGAGSALKNRAKGVEPEFSMTVRILLLILCY
jgi:hypothetical protein